MPHLVWWMGLSSEPHSEVSHHNKVESAGSFKIHYDLQSYQCVVDFFAHVRLSQRVRCVQVL